MRKALFTLLIIGGKFASAQDSILQKDKKLSLHFQVTAIPEYHFDIKSPYAGDNSLLASEPVKTSVTSTIFAAYKPFKNTYFVFNPEMAGGQGLSKTLGVAGFPNGEVYRVGDPAPRIFVARLYAEQRFPLSSKKEQVDDDQNQIKEKTNKDYISIIGGKFSLLDFFDGSEVSHDPRTQFLNWSLMANGAWDYPANTRGYNFGGIIQAFVNNWAFRYALTAMPKEANEANMEFRLGKASGMVVEVEKDNILKKDEKHYINAHAGVFLNYARMGNYETAVKDAAPGVAPDVTQSREYGRTKYGYYGGVDVNSGFFHYMLKASWSDGKNETWAFTEIDRSISMGIRTEGSLWKRNKDNAGIAYVNNGLSSEHKNYLAAGGYGFIIGDGQLNYGREQIIEAYYSCNIWKPIFLSPDYQFVLHPAYNKDRGPVNIMSLRLHVEF
ncbi:carbohydrate porin [Chitinophagaceae bacterium LWZ2-11]